MEIEVSMQDYTRNKKWKKEKNFWRKKDNKGYKGEKDYSNREKKNKKN